MGERDSERHLTLNVSAVLGLQQTAYRPILQLLSRKEDTFEAVEVIPYVSRIVAFIIKNINMIIIFTCLGGWLYSSPEVNFINILCVRFLYESVFFAKT